MHSLNPFSCLWKLTNSFLGIPFSRVGCLDRSLTSVRRRVYKTVSWCRRCCQGRYNHPRLLHHYKLEEQDTDDLNFMQSLAPLGAWHSLGMPLLFRAGRPNFGWLHAARCSSSPHTPRSAATPAKFYFNRGRKKCQTIVPENFKHHEVIFISSLFSRKLQWGGKREMKLLKAYRKGVVTVLTWSIRSRRPTNGAVRRISQTPLQDD